MTSTPEVVARVSQLAAGQWGMLTTSQAKSRGITRLHLARLADAGVLERVDNGVYATSSFPDEHRALRAAWLALDPARTAEERMADPLAAGVVSHTSAAGLHRLGDLLDDQPEITLPVRKQTRRNIRLHKQGLTSDEVMTVEGLPTTTPERTVVDLLRDGHDSEHVAQIIGQGVRQYVIDLDTLAAALDQFASGYGQPDGRALVEHFLDIVGLSLGALTAELAKSPVGHEIAEAAYLGALREIFEVFAAQISRAPLELRTTEKSADASTAHESFASALAAFASLRPFENQADFVESSSPRRQEFLRLMPKTSHIDFAPNGPSADAVNERVSNGEAKPSATWTKGSESVENQLKDNK